MKTFSKLAAFGITLAAIPALAGLHTYNQVTVDLSGRVAQGALGSAYNSSDSYQKMWCQTAAYRFSSGEVDEWMQCIATNAVGTQASCISYEPMIVEAARAISDGSLVTFTWDTSGVCQQIRVTKSSQFEAKGL